MTDTQTIDVAVIGAGRMGRHHARNYFNLPQANLVAIVDTDEDRAGAMADEYQCDVLTSIDALLEKYPNVKAASVSTPTITHEAIARELITNNVACLIEKPLAQSVEVAESIVKLAEEHNVLVQVGHSERFNPIVRALAGIDITPRFIEVDRVSPMTFRSTDVSVVFDIMIHDLDIILMLNPTALTDVRATGVAVLGQHADVANARLEFDNGCVANVTASRLAMKTERKLRLFSEDAYISINYAAKTGIVIRKTDNAEALHDIRAQLEAGADLSDVNYTELIDMQELEINDEEPLRAELSNFLNAAMGIEAPEVDARAGLAAVSAAEQVINAIKTHRWTGVDTTKPV